MADFIQGDDFDREGGKYEELVWKALKSSFSKREVLGYSRYPLFSRDGLKKKEPDILLLDKIFGLIVIEVKGFAINDIEQIQPNKWTIKSSYDRAINPLAQVEDYLFLLKGKFDFNRELRGKFKGKCLVALPNITCKEFNERGFLEQLDRNVFIFKDDLKDDILLNLIEASFNTIEGREMSNDGFKIAKSILGHEENHVEDINYDIKSGTKGEIYNRVKNKLYDLDIQQERIAKSIAPGPQRIRGIAGSGKTLLICQKAAYMHLKYPEWKIAVTFFTQSLYDTIIKIIDMYIRAFTNGENKYDPNSNLMVLHAWGRRDRNGLYREIASRNNCVFLNAKDVNNALGGFVNPEVSINYISQQLLLETKGNLEEIFDAILIDEGQDLVGDNKYKYKEKQAFYYMAYRSIKPTTSSDGKKLRKLIWAYDELQSLSDTKIPTGKEIFGDSLMVQGSYKGGIRKSEIMKKCYRVPHQILTAAHAIGMGFFRDNGMLTGYTTQKDWNNIGYNLLSGDFRRDGNDIILERPIENSPNPINEFYNGKCIVFNKYSNESSMLEDLSREVKKDIEFEKLKASRDILIINLKEGYKSQAMNQAIGGILNRCGVNYYIPGCGSLNVTKEINWINKKPDVFWMDNAVTISTITRAKGNEAAMVYIVGLEDIAVNEDNIACRNKLFTALTRAKCWVKLMGVGSYQLYGEIEQAINSNGKFKFKYKKPRRESNDNEIE